MIVGHKWAEVQPKCTLYIDGATHQWAIYLTNSPEEELHMIGIGVVRRDKFQGSIYTQHSIRKDMARCYYCTAHNTRDRQHVDNYVLGCNARMSTYLSDAHSVIDDIYRGNCGQIWITLGGRKVMWRLAKLMRYNGLPKLIDRAGHEYPQTPLEEWQKRYPEYTVRRELHECADSVGLEAAAMVMDSACPIDRAPPSDEDHIEQD